MLLDLLFINAYLSNFGSYEFQLVQAKYILSGFGLIGFSLVCFVYTGIKVNLSNISKSLSIDKILPWSLRVIALPMILITLVIAWNIPEFSGIMKATTYFFSAISVSP